MAEGAPLASSGRKSEMCWPLRRGTISVWGTVRCSPYHVHMESKLLLWLWYPSITQAGNKEVILNAFLISLLLACLCSHPLSSVSHFLRTMMMTCLSFIKYQWHQTNDINMRRSRCCKHKGVPTGYLIQHWGLKVFREKWHHRWNLRIEQQLARQRGGIKELQTERKAMWKLRKSMANWRHCRKVSSFELWGREKKERERDWR